MGGRGKGGGRQAWSLLEFGPTQGAGLGDIRRLLKAKPPTGQKRPNKIRRAFARTDYNTRLRSMRLSLGAGMRSWIFKLAARKFVRDINKSVQAGTISKSEGLIFLGRLNKVFKTKKVIP